MDEDKKKEMSKVLFGLYGFMFALIAFTLCFSLFSVNHTEVLKCQDHASNGFSTKLMGDFIHRECYIKASNLSKYIPLDSLYQIDNYAKLA